MKEFSLSRYLFLSIILHVMIVLFFVLGFETMSPLAVLENTNQQDVISAVVLGDTAKSKILPHDQPKPPPVKAIKPKPLPEPNVEEAPSPPVLKKNTAIETNIETKPTPDAIALSLKKPKKKEEKIAKEKKDTKLNIKPIFGQDLLADIKKETHKQKKKQEKALEEQFKKTLQAQSEKSLRQQLLNDDIKLKSQEAHMSQGEVNKYKSLIVQAISENWLVPPGTNKRLACELMIRVAKGGRVLDVQVLKSSGDQALDRSARAAVLKSSPLPVPTDEEEFNTFRQFALKVRPENVLSRG